MNWRESAPYLSIDYLDADVAELLELIQGELPFGRVRDGNVTAWVIRAEQTGMITTADRVHILAGLGAARRQRDLDRTVVA